MGPAQSFCGQNILNKLIEQYGGNVLSFVVAEKSKYFIDEKFTDLERRFHECFQQFQSSVKQLVEGKSSQITTAFQGLKNKANSLLPGGIAALQRVKGQSLNEFSGFSSLLARIDSIKSQSLGNLSIKKQQMITQLESQKSSMTQKIQKSKPNIPLYEQIPEPLRKELLKQVEKKFSKELNANEKDLETKILGLFNASALQKMFQEMSPQGILDKLLTEGYAMLEKNVFANITGGAIGGAGGFANIGGQFGNFFGNVLK